MARSKEPEVDAQRLIESLYLLAYIATDEKGAEVLLVPALRSVAAGYRAAFAPDEDYARVMKFVGELEKVMVLMDIVTQEVS